MIIFEEHPATPGKINFTQESSNIINDRSEHGLERTEELGVQVGKLLFYNVQPSTVPNVFEVAYAAVVEEHEDTRARIAFLKGIIAGAIEVEQLEGGETHV